MNLLDLGRKQGVSLNAANRVDYNLNTLREIKLR